MKTVQNVAHVLPRLHHLVMCTPLLSKGLLLSSILFSLLHVGGVFTVLISVLMMGVREKAGQSDCTQPSGITEGNWRADAGRTLSF